MGRVQIRPNVQNDGTRYVTLTANASANTKGAWAQIISSLPFDVSGLIVFRAGHDTAADYLQDLAIGGAGSEQVIVENALISRTGNCWRYNSWQEIPIYIPSGTRIAARCQSSTGGAKVNVTLGLLPMGSFGRAVMLAGCDTYGANTGDSGGTSLDPGGTIHTKGSWVQLSAGITRDCRAVSLSTGAQRNTARTNTNWLIDLGVGGAGSEQILIEDWLTTCHDTNDHITPEVSSIIPVSITAGTRIAARCQCAINDASDRLIDVLAHCFY
jgi:hypothetical protein